MVDDHANRSYAPGQQPEREPERDIEPLWPGAQADPAPSWTPAPGTPGQPSSPADDPWLRSGVPMPGIWTTVGPPGALRPWAADANPGLAGGATGPAPDSGTPSGWAPAEGLSSGWAPGGTPASDWTPRDLPPPPPSGDLTWRDRQTPPSVPTSGTSRPGAYPAPSGGGHSFPTPDAGPAFPPPPDGPDGGGGRTVGRPAESPWAHPPQRPAPARSPGDPSTVTRAAPAAPATPATGATAPAEPGTSAAPCWGAHATGVPTAPAWATPSETVPAATPPWPGAVGRSDDPGTAAAGDPPAVPPPGPFPPQPGGYSAPWQRGPAVQSGHQPAVERAQPAHPPAGWSPPVGIPPTAEDFARRRQMPPADPVATMGVRAVANRVGLRLPPSRHEQELRRDIEMVRRNFGGLRQVTVVNPKGGAGKTVAILLLAMTFGQKRGGYVLAWDNNETQGTLGMRAQQDFHARTVRDLLRDLNQFHGSHGRVGDLSQYVRSQGEGMFDVLASDESATGGEMLTADAFAEIREVVSRFYKLIFVDTGNNVRAQNWQAAMDATDQLVVTMSARNDSAETAARMLDHLEQSGRQRLVRQAVTVVSMPPSRKEIDLPAIQGHFSARTRAVLLAPYERLIDTGEPLRYGGLSTATRDAWLKIAAAVAEGL
ncbi:chromosome partitioning protein [Micromonospora sp. WMMA1363]|uniref:MinD/ParA family ATP-binding protein n=1 Tax=Micromonospora sp. WMMA1363 TaxID=3053985 RepID=UPI00259CAA95|nr:chromosome partitioning protein [Micromonospora sp. WMMA1363]MDM4721565.1 chromosome partitioning protein [Micromonospora sp. WMMA1363]